MQLKNYNIGWELDQNNNKFKQLKNKVVVAYNKQKNEYIPLKEVLNKQFYHIILIDKRTIIILLILIIIIIAKQQQRNLIHY